MEINWVEVPNVGLPKRRKEPWTVILSTPMASLEESNLFLRALWAQIRTRFGRLGWNFQPTKIGKSQLIHLGQISVGKGWTEGVEVQLKYERKGVIKEIIFSSLAAGDLETQLKTGLEQCATEALHQFRSPPEHIVEAHVLARHQLSSRIFPVATYRSDRWSLSPLENGTTKIAVSIRAFDDADQNFEFQTRLRPLLDLLAVCTNCVFEATDLRLGLGIHETTNSSFYDEDWLEGAPVADRLLRLNAAQLALGDQILDGKLDESHKLVRASHHFHEGISLYSSDFGRFGDLSTVLLMSALEVMSLTEDKDPSTCSSCNQPVYKISQRVYELGVKHLGPGIEQIFRAHYARRSKYLHVGSRYASQPPNTKLIPQLDPSAPNGCAMPSYLANPHNLIEFTSYIIRKGVLISCADAVT